MKKPTERPTRRRFPGQVAGAGVAGLAEPRALPGATGVNERVRLNFIGVGKRGDSVMTRNTASWLSSFAVIALLATAVQSSPPPGVVIDRSPDFENLYVGCPSIAVLPGGDYVASHSWFGPGSTKRVVGQVAVFGSKDRGQTWQHLADIKGQFWSGLFVHRGTLYITGVNRQFGDIVIRRSTDGGRSWSEPVDEQSGLLRDDARYHCAPVPVVVHKGKIWRAFELAEGGRPSWAALVLSAPVEADLLRAESWRVSEAFAHPWSGSQWIEGNIVVTPRGSLVNILRTNGQGADRAAIVHVSMDGKTLSHDREKDIIDFPGGGAKFTIRYDQESGRYWSLGNKQTNPEAVRNILVLTSSEDLRTWKVETVLLRHVDEKHHAWQYVDWLFEGDDIIAVSRTAWDGSEDYHDANYFTFHRIERFRELTMADATAYLREEKAIDRRAVVTRHNVRLTQFDFQSALQAGNGEFALSVDTTGLQTFDDRLGTYAEWGWHTFPNPEGYEYEDVLGDLEFYGHKAGYPDPFLEEVPEAQRTVGPTGLVKRYRRAARGDPQSRTERAFSWFRRNPHRLHLGRIGFELVRADGKKAALEDLESTVQTLDLWRGVITSEFALEGKPVRVVTCCHPELDLLAVRVASPLLGEKRLKVLWQFPYMKPSPNDGADWEADDRHETRVTAEGDGHVQLHRKLDADAYEVSVAWSSPGAKCTRAGPHRLVLTAAEGARDLSFVTHFAEAAAGELPDFEETQRAAATSWRDFWGSGGAIDLSGSKDPRWKELERRVVISQYATAIQCAGSSPPQETGLSRNSWYGKFHLEMTAWHGVHFVLWGREQLLERWMAWLKTTGLEAARGQARRQGYRGARWMKMLDRKARWESPSLINPFRITQQGHLIYLAELFYRIRPEAATLEEYRDVVLESAEFMADFLAWDERTERYVLGPPLIAGAESTFAPEAQNPTVELSYWAYGLETAQRWRTRLGMPRHPGWDEKLEKLAMPPTRDGVYINMESYPDQWTGRPAWLEAYGCMPGVRIDPAVMAKTYERITGEYDKWDKGIWGCDFPMFAMAAARLDRPADAIHWLLYDTQRNTCLPNGANTGGPCPYLPATGGFLWAVAMMAAGWDGCPDRAAPGFPDDGSWVVRSEGLRRAP